MKRFAVLLVVMMALCLNHASAQKKSKLEKELESIGLLNVAEEIPGVEVYMVYATPYNFMGRVLYQDLDEAYLTKEAMDMLKVANDYLRKRRNYEKNSPKTVSLRANCTCVFCMKTPPIFTWVSLTEREQSTPFS